MKYMTKIIFLIFILLISIKGKALSTGPEACKILFIGSSYFNYNNLPGLFTSLATASGKEVYIDASIRNGLYLDDHVKLAMTDTKIKTQDWDFVVLQGVGSLVAYPETYTDHPVYPALERLKKKITDNCTSTKIVFCLPWAFEDGMTWVRGWTDTYADMQLKIYENTLKYADELGLVIAPVGWAWNTVLQEKNYPLHYLHLSDWNHPSKKGSYLMACVIFSTLFQESGVGLTFYGDLSIDEAVYFQTVGSNTVLDNPERWNLISTETEKIEFALPVQFYLHQNYPNPFNQSTCINYEISTSGLVEIALYDVNGKFYGILNKSWQTAGGYSIKFDARDLNSGIYFYRIKFGNQWMSRKMLFVK